MALAHHEVLHLVGGLGTAGLVGFSALSALTWAKCRNGVKNYLRRWSSEHAG